MHPRPVRDRSITFGTHIAFSLALVMGLVPRPMEAALLAQQPVSPEIQALSYADLADLALPSQVVVGVNVTKAQQLKGELAPGLAAGRARFLVYADVEILLRGAEGLPGAISYIVDTPLEANGKPPKLKKTRQILIADRVAGRPLEVRLNSPYSQLAWTQPTESRLRAILTEAGSARAAPQVSGVGNAFHVPGSIPGEGETQIFLTTRNDQPISLSVLRRPGEQRQWAVALGEMVDESAQAPAPETLSWYRLACFLPAGLPDSSVAALSESDAAIAREDYAFVISRLGPCNRTIGRAPRS